MSSPSSFISSEYSPSRRLVLIMPTFIIRSPCTRHTRFNTDYPCPISSPSSSFYLFIHSCCCVFTFTLLFPVFSFHPAPTHALFLSPSSLFVLPFSSCWTVCTCGCETQTQTFGIEETLSPVPVPSCYPSLVLVVEFSSSVEVDLVDCCYPFSLFTTLLTFHLATLVDLLASYSMIILRFLLVCMSFVSFVFFVSFVVCLCSVHQFFISIPFTFPLNSSSILHKRFLMTPPLFLVPLIPHPCYLFIPQSRKYIQYIPLLARCLKLIQAWILKRCGVYSCHGLGRIAS